MKGALYTAPPIPAIKFIYKWPLTLARNATADSPLKQNFAVCQAAGEKPSKDLYSRNSPKA